MKPLNLGPRVSQNITPLFNPFHPNQPASPAGFVGRSRETRQLATALSQVRGGKTGHRLIVGERGIGKSSLLLYIEHLARGKKKLPNGKRLQFITVRVSITSGMSESDFLREVEGHLEAEISQLRTGRAFLKKLKKGLSEVKVGVLKFDLKKDAAKIARSIQIKFIAETIKNITSSSGLSPIPVHGALLLIDECDQASPSFCEFLRVFIEEVDNLTRCKCLIIAAGLPATLEVFDKGHKSLRRILRELKIGRLDERASAEFSDKYLELASGINDIHLAATQSAKALIVSLGSGHPHYLQQIGSAGFDQWNYRREIDSGRFPNLDVLTSGDIAMGAFSGQDCALAELASIHSWSPNKQGIREPEYREILACMYCSATKWAKWSDIRMELSNLGYKKEDSILEARERLVRNGVIFTEDDECFSFVEWLFVLYIRSHHCKTNFLDISKRMSASGAVLKSEWRRQMTQAESAFLISHIASKVSDVRRLSDGTYSAEIVKLLSQAAEICSSVRDLEQNLRESERILEPALAEWLDSAKAIEGRGGV